jgi:hypothetical protein
MAKLNLGVFGAIALLLAGGLPAHAAVITLAVSSTLTATPPGTCSPTCTLSGDIVINNSSGAANGGFVSADVTASGFGPSSLGPFGPYTSFISLGPLSNPVNEELQLGSSSGTALDLGFVTPSASSLVGYTGGPLIFANVILPPPLESIFNSSSGSLTETPLPATLPLFATGLGAFGLLGWRRKRKAQA